jgi:hypothetical protein
MILQKKIINSFLFKEKNRCKPVNEIVANVLRSNGGAHHRQMPCAAG